MFIQNNVPGERVCELMLRSRSPLLLTFALSLVVALAPSALARDFRVALLGDSLAYGAGDEAGKGIAGRLEPELRTRGAKTVVTTNLGINGATTADVGARLQDRGARKALGSADAIVLSMGANDVRHALRRDQSVRAPLDLIEQVLNNLDATVAELHRINPAARILILGAYAPVPHERTAILLEPLIALWDATVLARFADDPLVEIVRMSDIVNRPERLSPIDSFHPGGEAYQQTAARIAELLVRAR